MDGPLNVRNIRTFCVLACLVSKRNESERKRKQFADGGFQNCVVVKSGAEESWAHRVQNSAALKVKYPGVELFVVQDSRKTSVTVQHVWDSITKVRLSLCMPLRHIGGVEVYVHSIVTSALDWETVRPEAPVGLPQRKEHPVRSEQEAGSVSEQVWTSWRRGKFLTIAGN